MLFYVLLCCFPARKLQEYSIEQNMFITGIEGDEEKDFASLMKEAHCCYLLY